MSTNFCPRCKRALRPEEVKLRLCAICVQEVWNGVCACPFCGAGRFEATGTAGRLACDSCGSIVLDGRKKEAVTIGG
jgi:hypothetical protein